MEKERVKVGPELYAYMDDNLTRITVETVLPGVHQDDIDLKITEDSFSLSACTDDIDYVAAYSFCCPVNANKVEAIYDNGLLKIEAPFKDPMEDAIKVSVKVPQALASRSRRK